MPFDEQGFEVTTKRTAEQHARLIELIEALEDEQRLKDLGQAWDYTVVYAPSECTTVGCALATSMLLGHLQSVGDTRDAYGLTGAEDYLAFEDAANELSKLMSKVTPSDVASILRAYL